MSKVLGFQHVAKLLLAITYSVAGVAHLAYSEQFALITPEWVPAPSLVIAVTGVLELLGGAALYVPRLTKLAGLALALYAVCVFPANINHAVMDLGWFGYSGGAVSGLGLSYHVPRLLFQPVFVWWALFASGWLVWPFCRVEQPKH